MPLAHPAKSASSVRRRGRWLPVVLVLALLPACLTPEEAVEEVDREAYDIIEQNELATRGVASGFSIDPQVGRLAALDIDPETGVVAEGTRLEVTLSEVLAIAAKNSREFQDQKERLYRASLSLMTQRETFRESPFALFGGEAASVADSKQVGGDGTFGITKVLQRGGSYVLALGLDWLRFVSSPTAENFTSSLNLSISLPFLRNAGQQIVIENLRQADRDTLYALRDFERFKQTYGVQVISSYLSILGRVQRVQNARANIESLEYAENRNQAYFEEGRLTKVQVDQAGQQVLTGRDRLVRERQTLQRSQDTFKNLIGVPVDLELVVELDDLKSLRQTMGKKLEVDADSMVRLALKSRLDLRNAVDNITDAMRRVRVAENQLLPDLTLNLGGSAFSENLKPLKYDFSDGTYSADVDFDPGLDRDIESIALRRALIDLQVALRNQEALAEQIKFQVRDAHRNLVRSGETYRINLEAVKLAEVRVESTRTLLELGRVATRDFLESQEALVDSQDDLVEALVQYRIAYLDLLRDTGVLAVAPGGLDHDTSLSLLLQG